ncbi:MAG: type II secretion system F family protein [Coxiellaceae bacterium]|nr:type II secretion system F family protein [Coxiellaceae bacterium]
MKYKLSAKLLIRLFDQWLYGLQSGLALNQTFDLLLGQTKNKSLHHINKHCLSCINNGLPLSLALHKLQLKPAWICSYIAAGETQGDLGTILQQLNQQLKQQQTIRQNIKKALFYPCTVLSIALLITIALLILVIPQFESIYQQFNAPLPYITQITLALSEHIQHHGIRIFFFTLTPVCVLTICIKKIKRLQLLIDKLFLQLPLISNLTLMINLSRWYSLVALLLNAGISIDKTLSTANTSLSNFAIKQMMQKLVLSVQQGQSIATYMLGSTVFSAFDCQMIQLGESTGQLSQTCQHLANYYQLQLHQLSTLVSQWLEPVIMLLLAVIVGGLVMAMYAPIFNLGNIM